MRVKVVKCSDPRMWYNDSSFIESGTEFNVVGEYEYYIIQEGNLRGKAFLKEDCELVQDINNNKVLKETVSKESLLNDEYFRRQLIISLAGNSRLLELEGKANFPEAVVNMAYKIRQAMK